MATELERTLYEALARTLSWLTSYAGGTAMGPTGPYEQARRAIAAYDTAQSQPGDDVKRDAIMWRYYCPWDRDKHPWRTFTEEQPDLKLVIDYGFAVPQPGDMGEASSGESGAVADVARDAVRSLAHHLESFLFRSVDQDKADAAMLRKLLCDNDVLKEKVKFLGRETTKLRRELDAARDRGEARTAEGVGGGALTGECVNCGCELPTGCGGQFADEDACPGYKIVSKSTPPAGMVTVPVERRLLREMVEILRAWLNNEADLSVTDLTALLDEYDTLAAAPQPEKGT